MWIISLFTGAVSGCNRDIKFYIFDFIRLRYTLDYSVFDDINFFDIGFR